MTNEEKFNIISALEKDVEYLRKENAALKKLFENTLTLRDMFAIAAMQTERSECGSYRDDAIDCYSFADAMLEARRRKQ